MNRLKKYLIILIIIEILFVFNVNSLKCFTCSYAKSDGIEGEDCIKNPNSVKAVNKITPCDKKYCTITMQEKSGSNTVESITRTCENKPHVSKKIISNSTNLSKLLDIL